MASSRSSASLTRVESNSHRNPLSEDYVFDPLWERQRAEHVLATTDLWVRQQDAKAMLAALDELERERGL